MISYCKDDAVGLSSSDIKFAQPYIMTDGKEVEEEFLCEVGLTKFICVECDII